MLHDYDGMDRLEEDIDWAGPDGLHEPWVHDPQRDDSTIGRGKSNDSVEVELAHDRLKRQLITSYTWRSKHNDIVWLRRRATAKGSEIPASG